MKRTYFSPQTTADIIEVQVSIMTNSGQEKKGLKLGSSTSTFGQIIYGN